MRNRGILLLTARLERYSKAASASVSTSSFSSLAAPYSAALLSPLPSNAAATAASASSFSSSCSSASTREFGSAVNFKGDGRDHDKNGRRRIPNVPFLTAAGAFSTSFALSAMSASLAKERIAPDNLPKEVVLYQYEACPFCNKVKAFLDYHDIPYQVVEVNPVGKKELKWSDYKKLPVLVVDGVQLNDSTAIVTSLNKQLNNGQALNDEEINEEEKWRRWVDDHLVHLLSPNIYRSPTEALQAFEYIAENGNFSATEKFTAKYFGATAMYFISKRLKKRHKIVDERASLYEAADTWVEALNGRKYLGGDKPNLADLAVFGVLRPIRHLQSGEDMVANSKIGTWYGNMEEAVGASSRLATSFQTSELGKPVQSTV